LFASILATPVAALAQANPGAAQPALGLPMPDPKAMPSLDAALAVFEQSPDTVVAQVGSRAVTWGDVADAIRTMPPIVATLPLQQVYSTATIQLMQQKALADLADNSGLAKDPAVARHMRNAEDAALADEYLKRSIAPNITDQALHKLYKAVVDGQPGPDEVRARIIMAETKEQATILIQRLQAGADFAALAREASKDATAANGGDLGYARLDALSPEIGAVAFSLAPGQFTAFPVKSGYYWFIIKSEGRSQEPTPTYEQARQGLEQDVLHDGMPKLRNLALQGVKVTVIGPAGTTAPAKAAN
jgi:peptidyl-prolyl cis-trans isomerase C